MGNRLIDEILMRGVDDPRIFLRTETRAISHREFVGATADCAAALAAAGVRQGDLVIVQIEKSPLALTLAYACWRLGAVLVPLNPKFSSDMVQTLCGRMRPRLVACHPTTQQAFGRLFPQAQIVACHDTMLTLPAGVDGHADGWREAAVAEDDTALILFTTGTSGLPKPCMLSFRNLRGNAQALTALWRIGPDDVILHALPLYHIHGLVVATNVALAAGASMISLKAFDPKIAMAHGSEATVMMGAPFHYLGLLETPGFDAASFPDMRLPVSGGALLSRATHEAFARRCGWQILERYGITEAGMVASAEPGTPLDVGSVGRAIPDTEIRIADPTTGAACAAGEIGEIEVRGAGVFNGYWSEAGPDRRTFRPDGFFRTADLARPRADGSIEYIGRESETIALDGRSIHPAVPERALETMPGVLEAAAIGDLRSDGAMGLLVVAVPEPGVTLDPQALERALAAVPDLAGVPFELCVTPFIPRSPSGKIQKRTLKSDLGLTDLVA